MKKRIYLGIGIVVLVLTGILSVYASRQTEVGEDLTMPSIPSDLKEASDRAGYLIEHFWDAMDWENDPRANDSKWLEQTFVNFLSVFPVASPDAREKAVNILLEGAQKSPKAYSALCELAELYLYEPDSPMLDEETYILFLKNIVNSPILDNTHKIRPRMQLDSALKNRIGSKTADFTFETREGKKMKLSQIALSGPAVLMFYDPDCDHCNKTLDYIKTNPKALVGVLESYGIPVPTESPYSVIAVYSGDEKDLWQQTSSDLPSSWIVGYEDGTIQDEGIYIIRDLPSVYLVDKDFTVLAKQIRLLNDKN